ncbi:MAG: hypothetical protein R3D69_07050 [Xanthobacteraceae bacterium]
MSTTAQVSGQAAATAAASTRRQDTVLKRTVSPACITEAATSSRAGR